MGTKPSSEGDRRSQPLKGEKMLTESSCEIKNNGMTNPTRTKLKHKAVTHPALLFDEIKPTKSSLTIRLTDDERDLLTDLAHRVTGGNLSKALRGLIRALAQQKPCQGGTQQKSPSKKGRAK